MSASRTMFITSLGGSAKTGPAASTANAPAMAAVLICPSFQKIFWRRMAVDVEHHRDQRVVARHADQVDDAALAEPLEHRLVSGVAHEFLFVQLGAEVVHGSLVVLHGRRAAPLREVRRDARRKTRLQRERVMRVPLVLRAPVARRDEDREFVQARRQRAVEADVLAHPLRAVGELRAAQQRVERSPHAAPRTARDLLVHLALRVVQLADGQRPEPRPVLRQRRGAKRNQRRRKRAKICFHVALLSGPSIWQCSPRSRCTPIATAARNGARRRCRSPKARRRRCSPPCFHPRATSCATARSGFAARGTARPGRSGCSSWAARWKSGCRTAARASSSRESISIPPMCFPQNRFLILNCTGTGALSVADTLWSRSS